LTSYLANFGRRQNLLKEKKAKKGICSLAKKQNFGGGKFCFFASVLVEGSATAEASALSR